MLGRRLLRQRCGVTVEIDDVDANSRGQARFAALKVDGRDEIVHAQAPLGGDVTQRLPHHRLEPDAGAVPCDHDVVDRQRGGRTVVDAAIAPRR